MRKNTCYVIGLYPFKSCTQALMQRMFDFYPQILNVLMSLIIEQMQHSESGCDASISWGVEI